MSWKPEVQADNTGQWYNNALRFETEPEAISCVKDLASRWYAVRDTRVTECEDKVNARWIDGKTEHLDDVREDNTQG